MKTKLPPKGKFEDAALTLRAAHWEEFNKVDRRFDNVNEEDGVEGAENPSNDLAHEWKYERFKSSGIYELSADGCIRPKVKAQDIGASLLKAIGIPGRGRFRLPVHDKRVFIHVQTKNKHPHSTKKHK